MSGMGSGSHGAQAAHDRANGLTLEVLRYVLAYEVRIINGQPLAGREDDDPLPADVVDKALRELRDKIANAEAPQTMTLFGVDARTADYKQWIDVGFRLHRLHGGSDEAFETWCRWSAQSNAKLVGDARMRAMWDTFR